MIEFDSFTVFGIRTRRCAMAVYMVLFFGFVDSVFRFDWIISKGYDYVDFLDYLSWLIDVISRDIEEVDYS